MGANHQLLASYKSAGGGALPSLLFDGINSTGEGQWDFGDGANTFYAGHELFSDSSAHTVTKVVWKLSKINGDISGKYFIVRIYADSGANHDLGTLIGSSDVVAGSNGWSKTTVDFTFSTTAPLSASTNYHIVICPCDSGGSNLSPDGGNRAAAWYTTPSNIPGQLDYFSSSGVNQYPGTFGNHDLQLQIWGTTP